MLHKDLSLQKSFSAFEFHLKFYKILYQVHLLNQFSSSEFMKIINLLLNLATHNDFFYLFEERISADIHSPTELLETLLSNKESKAVKYISISNEDIVFIIFKIMFELNSDITLKHCYLKIIQEVTEFSLYNSLSCGQVLINLFL